LRKKKGQDNFQKQNFEEHQKVIFQSLRKIETEDLSRAYASISEIMHFLREKRKPLSRPAIYKHLRILENKNIVSKVGKGRYSSRMALLARKLYTSLMTRETAETIPSLWVQDFDEITSEHFSEIRFSTKKGDESELFLNLAELNLEKQSLRDLQTIAQFTEITVLSECIIDELEKEYLKREVAKFLLYYISHRRNKTTSTEEEIRLLKRLNEGYQYSSWMTDTKLINDLYEYKRKKEEFDLKNQGIQLIIIFNPNKPEEKLMDEFTEYQYITLQNRIQNKEINLQNEINRLFYNVNSSFKTLMSLKNALKHIF